MGTRRSTGPGSAQPRARGVDLGVPGARPDALGFVAPAVGRAALVVGLARRSAPRLRGLRGPGSATGETGGPGREGRGRIGDPPVDGPHERQCERGDPVGLGVRALEDLALDRERQEPVCPLRLHGQLAELHARPSDELRGGSGSFRGDIHAHERDDQPGRRRREDLPAGRIVAPRHPAFRVRAGAERRDDRLDDREHLRVRGRPHRRRRPPFTQAHASPPPRCCVPPGERRMASCERSGPGARLG